MCGVLQLRNEMDLAVEPLDTHRGREIRWKDFDDDASVKRTFHSGEDATRSAARDLTFDAVHAAEGALETSLHGRGGVYADKLVEGA